MECKCIYCKEPIADIEKMLVAEAYCDDEKCYRIKCPHCGSIINVRLYLERDGGEERARKANVCSFSNCLSRCRLKVGEECPFAIDEHCPWFEVKEGMSTSEWWGDGYEDICVNRNCGDCGKVGCKLGLNEDCPNYKRMWRSVTCAYGKECSRWSENGCLDKIEPHCKKAVFKLDK